MDVVNSVGPLCKEVVNRKYLLVLNCTYKLSFVH